MPSYWIGRRSMQLRPYQENALGALRAAADAGLSRLLFQCPTGAGKTVVAAAVVSSARSLGSAALFVAHRLELIDQAVAQIAAWGVPRIGVIRADDERTDPGAPVQVATIQTLARRKLPHADIVIVDEAHRIMADQYQRVISAYPDAIIIGLTATPCRMDGKGLGNTFQKLISVVTYSDLIAIGSIVAPIVYGAHIEVDLSEVHTVQGDYKLDELNTKMVQPQVVGSVVDEWADNSMGRRSVIFAVTLEHSRALVASLQGAGARAEHLDGTTPLDERRAILGRLKAGPTQVVSNVGVLCEGWDMPEVKCGSIARPTKSLALFMQMVGRFLRPWGDVTPVLIDHGGNVMRHGLPHEDRVWTLETGGRVIDRMKLRTCPGCYAFVTKNPCPLCGFAPPVEAREVRVDASVKLTKFDGDPRKLAFDRLVEQSRAKGFKPGYASAKWKEANGDQWPPRSWSDEAKNKFAADEEWQKRQRYRELEREHWQGHQRTQEHKKKAMIGVFDEPPEAEPHAFGGLIDTAPDDKIPY